MGVKTLHADDGFVFRDLNKNGRLDPYEDSRRPLEERVEDLLAQMTLEEKAGMLFQPPIGMNANGSLKEKSDFFSETPTAELVTTRLLNHFNVFAIAEPRLMAEWYNRLQVLAEETRLGIPVTISSDPRHSFSHNPAASIFAGAFSQWPEPIGLAATGNPALVEEFGDIARQEYLAVGIRAVIPEIAAESAALIANFGANDAAVLDVIFGRFAPTGKLPFELPSSMEAVRNQKEDVPYDSEHPLFPFGYGLTY